jgi:hypothetical protein
LNIIYAVYVNNIADCLEEYSNNFENGVPIQEELSEIAANYTARSAEPTREFRASFDNIIRHLDSFSNEDGADNSASSCKHLPMFAEVDEYRTAALASRSTLPYRSMLEAAVLTASGYPVEGARHLEREYKRFSDDLTRLEGEESDSDSNRSGALMEFVLRVRMLSMLEQMFEVAGKPDDQIRTLRQLASLIEVWLARVTDVSAVSPKAWFMACRDGKLRLQDATGEAANQPFSPFARLAKELQQETGQKLPITLEKQAKKLLEAEKYPTDPELATALQGQPRKLVEALEQLVNKPDIGLRFDDPKSLPDEFERFLSTYGHVLMNTHLRLFEELFWRESEPIKVADLDTAGEYAELALNEPELLWDCFNKYGRIDDTEIETMRFDILRAYGLLQAAHATRVVTTDPRATLDMDDASLRESLCGARSTLIASWRLGQDVKQAGSHGQNDSTEAANDSSQIDRDLRPVQHVLTRLSEQPLACRS